MCGLRGHAERTKGVFTRECRNLQEVRIEKKIERQKVYNQQKEKQQQKGGYKMRIETEAFLMGAQDIHSNKSGKEEEARNTSVEGI